jgi:hypothetical protein
MAHVKITWTPYEEMPTDVDELAVLKSTGLNRAPAWETFLNNDGLAYGYEVPLDEYTDENSLDFVYVSKNDPITGNALTTLGEYIDRNVISGHTWFYCLAARNVSGWTVGTLPMAPAPLLGTPSGGVALIEV